MLAMPPVLCADRPFLPTIAEHFVFNWELLNVSWQVPYNPVYNTTYTAWFWNRYVTKYHNVRCWLSVVSYDYCQ